MVQLPLCRIPLTQLKNHFIFLTTLFPSSFASQFFSHPLLLHKENVQKEHETKIIIKRKTTQMEAIIRTQGQEIRSRGCK